MWSHLRPFFISRPRPKQRSSAPFRPTVAVMHPSLMPSYFAPPMPFHPEELHKHVKQLEQTYAEIPSADGNARIAVAKAIISATASFVEGCLDDLTRFTLAEVGVPHPIGEWVLEKRRGFQRL